MHEPNTAWAREIAGGNGSDGEVFYQAPFYPYFLAAIYSVFGDGPWAPRLAQIGLGSLSCLLLALAGRRFFTARTGVLAGVLLALYAPAIYYDGLLQKASLGLFFSAALLFLLGEFREKPGWERALYAGALLGCFALTRENTLILVPLVGLWLWLEPGRARRWFFPEALAGYRRALEVASASDERAWQVAADGVKRLAEASEEEARKSFGSR